MHLPIVLGRPFKKTVNSLGFAISDGRTDRRTDTAVAIPVFPSGGTPSTL
jgi:hypothetical protein